MNNIAIFASGNGTNAENIIRYFDQKPNFNISCIISNNDEAKVLERAQKLNIESRHFSRTEFKESSCVVRFLETKKIDLIVLAGFLQLIPHSLVNQYFIINIHPALLPKYGGKGMYGNNIHKAVIKNKEHESGITIHRVNEVYDEGEILLQKKCEVKKEDTYQSLATRIHELEYQFYPRIIEQVLRKKELTPKI